MKVTVEREYKHNPMKHCYSNCKNAIEDMIYNTLYIIFYVSTMEEIFLCS